MCKIITERGMVEIGDPRDAPQYGYSTVLEEEHDPHWDRSELKDVNIKNILKLTVTGLPFIVTPQEKIILLKGRINRGEVF